MRNKNHQLFVTEGHFIRLFEETFVLVFGKLELEVVQWVRFLSCRQVNEFSFVKGRIPKFIQWLNLARCTEKSYVSLVSYKILPWLVNQISPVNFIG